MGSLELVETEDGGHWYRFDGRRVPGVSEILEASDVMIRNAFFEERKEAAAIRGRDIHLACADLDRGLPAWWEDDEIAPYVQAYQQFKQDFSFRPKIIEKPMFQEHYRYAGTPDRMGLLKMKDHEVEVTLDLKATSVIGCHVRLQLAGYNQFADDADDRITCALQLKPNGKYQAHWGDPRDKKHDLMVFLSCLTLLTWRDRNHKTNIYT